jgi:hypothetical protein
MILTVDTQVPKPGSGANCLRQWLTLFPLGQERIHAWANYAVSLTALVAFTGCGHSQPQIETLQLTPTSQIIRHYFPPATKKPLFDFPSPDPPLGEEHVYIRHPLLSQQEEVRGSPFFEYRQGCRLLETGGYLFLILRSTLHYRSLLQKPEASHWVMWQFDSSSELYEYVYNYFLHKTSSPPRVHGNERGASRMDVGGRWFVFNRPYLGWDLPYRIESVDAERWQVVCAREVSVRGLPRLLVFTRSQDSDHLEPTFRFDFNATSDANQDFN